MRNCDMIYKGKIMNNNHINETNIYNEILPEINNIYRPANILWVIESILDEDVNKGIRDAAENGNDLDDSAIEQIKQKFLNCQLNSDRDNSDYITTILYYMMDPDNKSSSVELTGNLFHIYIFPFYSNTLQGNAMWNFGNHAFVGSWSNKYTGGDVPYQSALTEDSDEYGAITIGSLSRTIAHELGHDLNLQHESYDGCVPCSTIDCSPSSIEVNYNEGCLMGGRRAGYALSQYQKDKAYINASYRVDNDIVLERDEQNLLKIPEFDKNTIDNGLILVQNCGCPRSHNDCDADIIQGCTDTGAENYVQDANIENGSCIYYEDMIQGCTDIVADNYDLDANIDDGSCIYPEGTVWGCTDTEAYNYDHNAVVDDDSCTYDAPTETSSPDVEKESSWSVYIAIFAVGSVIILMLSLVLKYIN